MFQRTIGLTPVQGGGRCISVAALRAADIILSTTRSVSSAGIRIATGGEVSHAAIYAGGGTVVEAISPVVLERPIGISLGDDALAVAYRMPALSSTKAQQIVTLARSKKGAPYSYVGAGLAEFHAELANNPGYYCSQLVAQVFASAGARLKGTTSSAVTPQDLAGVAAISLQYVGHLKGDPTYFPMLFP
jgi:cell wall-associated NlpC family hydrolase